MQGVGEDLREAGVADESVDAVVMTLVLCTVDDQIKSEVSFLAFFNFLLLHPPVPFSPLQYLDHETT